MKKNKTLKNCSIIFLIMGVAFLIASIITFFYINNFVRNGEETTATIISITSTDIGGDTDYRVKVEYYVNNVKYSNYINQYHSGMSVGQNISIIYMPNNPTNIIYGENVYLMFWVFMGIGVLFSISGYILLVVIKRRRRALSLENVKNEQAKIIEIKKPSLGKYIILSLPVVGQFYAMFRMLFLLNEHYDAPWSFFSKRLWKSCLSCGFIMLTALIINTPLFILLSFIAKAENNILLIIFSLLIFISIGFWIYFLTNYVIKRSKYRSE